MKDSNRSQFKMSSAFINSPLGILKIESDGKSVRSISIETKKHEISSPEMKDNPAMKNCIHQLQEYFEGKRKSFDFEMNLDGTDFQKKVWKETKKIKFGETLAYSDIAKRIHNPKAVRAVGAALGENPVLLAIPCHRVIAKSKKLTGFRGGLGNKAKLLEFEGSAFRS